MKQFIKNPKCVNPVNEKKKPLGRQHPMPVIGKLVPGLVQVHKE